MATIQKNDVIGAIEVYLRNNNRPCPAHYLTDKFGDDVAETIADLKKSGIIVGKRGRTGGIAFPDSVFPKKGETVATAIEATPIEFEGDSSDMSDEDTDDSDMSAEA